MEFKTITIGKKEVAQITSHETFIKGEAEALEIMGESDAEYIILYEENFEKDFFDLSTRKLGEFLQKLTNYRVRLAIVGHFDAYASNSLKDFIYESNKHGDYVFVASVDKVKTIWK